MGEEEQRERQQQLVEHLDQYGDIWRVQRIIHAAEKGKDGTACPLLESCRAYFTLHPDAWQLYRSYRKACVERKVSLLGDLSEERQVEDAYKARLEPLWEDLQSSQTNEIQESIRLSAGELGQAQQECGDWRGALESYIIAREHCSSVVQLVETTTRAVIAWNFALGGRDDDVLGFWKGLKRAMEEVGRVDAGAFNCPRNPETLVSLGAAAIIMKDYSMAAKLFAEMPEDAVCHWLSGQDIAMLVVLSFLASYQLWEMRALVLVPRYSANTAGSISSFLRRYPEIWKPFEMFLETGEPAGLLHSIMTDFGLLFEMLPLRPGQVQHLLESVQSCFIELGLGPFTVADLKLVGSFTGLEDAVLKDHLKERLLVDGDCVFVVTAPSQDSLVRITAKGVAEVLCRSSEQHGSEETSFDAGRIYQWILGRDVALQDPKK